MLKTSFYFFAVALLCLCVADVGFSTLEPWFELGRMAHGMLTPDMASLLTVFDALVNTVTFALCGIALAVAGGIVLAFLFDWTPVRLACGFVRAIHEIFWAFIFLPIVGLNPICGVLAIAIPYAGVFAKVYAEIRQEADQRPLDGIPIGTGRLSRYLFGVLPVIYANAKNYTAYRFECALRSSAILGFIGLPTLGYHLETAFREGLYSQAAALLYAFYLLIASLRFWGRPKIVGFIVILSFIFISKETSISLVNAARFFTYDILPWPMRRDGFYNGTMAVSYPWREITWWFVDVLKNEGLRGIWSTVVLTQIALAGSGLLALAGFPLACRHFSNRLMRWCAHGVLIIMRTTPEYILAYLFVQLLGPSMLPAILALCLHNGAILAYLGSRNADLIPLTVDAPRRRTDSYLYEVLPRIYGQFLAFLFYRWEVIMRESAILGLLGIYTLGFFIDSAIADQQLDKALVLIILTAMLNIGIDTISQIIRRRLKISVQPASYK